MNLMRFSTQAPGSQTLALARTRARQAHRRAHRRACWRRLVHLGSDLKKLLKAVLKD